MNRFCQEYLPLLISFLRTSFCFWSLFALACTALLWPGLVNGDVPAFRDAFHFYYPQAVWLDQCALRGEFFPLWQSNESLGVSVPGETTSAIFYPMRIVWFLPSLSVAQRFAAFVLAHLLLAGWGMQYACSRLRLRKEAGWMAGATFALSCPILFQHNNLVFLCSAAWLGFALAEFSCWLHVGDTESQPPRMIVLAGSVAMMVLAGDPHTAVNIFVLAAFLATVRGIAKWSFAWLVKSTIWLVAVALLAVGLSAVQSIPSLMWVTQSHRWLGNSDAVSSGMATGIEQAIPSDPTIPSSLSKILSEPTRRSSNAIYEFSLSPWHLLTLIWPTLGGSFAPENSRTFSYIAAEGRMWVPSLFFGVVPLLFLIRRAADGNIATRRVSEGRSLTYVSGWNGKVSFAALLSGFRKSFSTNPSWLVLAAIFALLASFGNYSFGWLLREALNASGANLLSQQLPPDHYSSLYGILVEWLPGYNLFRYPAKWSAIFVACATLAAATRIDPLSDADLLRTSSVQRVVLSLSGIGLIMTLACNLLAIDFDGLRTRIRPDAWMGTPIDSAMLSQLLIAFSVPIVVLGIVAAVRWREKMLNQSSKRAHLPVHAAFAWISLLETFIVATCWCTFVAVNPTAPHDTWTAEFVWADMLEADIEQDGWLTPTTSGASVTVTNYQGMFVLGKLGLLSHQHNLASILSIEPERFKRLRIGLARVDDLSIVQPKLDVMLGWLGVEQRLVRERNRGERASFSWQPIPDTRQLCELRFTDLSRSQAATVNWRWSRSGQLEIAIDSPSSCRLLVRQFNDGGWRAVSDREAGHSPQLKRDSSGLFVECDIAAGKSKLTLQRIQWPLQLGLAISLASLLLAFGIGWFQLRIASATMSRSK